MRADDAKIVRSRNAQCKTRESLQDAASIRGRRLFGGGVYCKPCKNNCEFIVPLKVPGKSTREIGLVVPARFSAVTTEWRIAEVLMRQLSSHEV